MLPFKLAEFAFSKAGKIAAAVVVAAGLYIGFRNEQRQIGAHNLQVKKDKANAVAKKTVDAAAARSRDPGAGGVRDPHLRAD